MFYSFVQRRAPTAAASSRLSRSRLTQRFECLADLVNAKLICIDEHVLYASQDYASIFYLFFILETRPDLNARGGGGELRT